MKAPCTLSQMRNGTWLVRHSSSTLGTAEVSAASREEALTKMRNEWRYKPNMVNGKAVPVCTAVTFNYSQK